MNKKKDYSKTVNLPKTDFQMKADLVNKELVFIEEWDRERLYVKICEKNKDKEKFIFHDGPPYANANIHIGTGLNKSFERFHHKVSFYVWELRAFYSWMGLPRSSY